MRLTLIVLLTAAGAMAAERDTCRECHAVLEGPLAAPAKAFEADVHARNGFSCVDCHGGDASQEDPQASMNRARGFRGKVARTGIPALCGGCHADAARIHKVRPQQRVDQLAQYQTSVHGQRLAKGDTAVATCIDCHSVHNILEVKDPRAPVHPLRLPETCARCHADQAHMSKYKIETTQFEQYRESVHWAALSKRGDVSAPSCASCHGNHGATPPAVESIGAVCGTCHVLFENMYKASPHKAVFDGMGLAGCVVCHGNHKIGKPDPSMLAGEKAVCSQCHDGESKGGKTAAAMAQTIRGLSTALDRSDGALEMARQSGMDVGEALLKQIEAKERLVKSRVAIHTLDPGAVNAPATEGMALAAETLAEGQGAMRERDNRRYWMAASLVFILVTMIGLRMKIRSMEGG